MDAISTTKPAERRGFTLVEMLTVIVIIAILTGMITGAAIRVRTGAKIKVIAAELVQLDLAVKNYKTKFGDYPPDFTDPDAVVRHIRRAFPRYIPGAATGGTGATDWENIRNDVFDGTSASSPSVDIFALTPASALHFWLAGPDGRGFCANPRNPFDMTSSSRIKPFYNFDPERVVVSANDTHEYYPPGIPTTRSRPHVYFRANNGVYDTTVQKWSESGSDPPECLPCQNTLVADWANPDSFQILSAGLDGLYDDPADPDPRGIGYPAGTDYDDAQYDDQSNFCSGTFEDEMP